MSFDIEQLWTPPSYTKWDDLPLQVRRVLMYSETGAMHNITEKWPDGLDYEIEFSWADLFRRSEPRDLPLSPKKTTAAATSIDLGRRPHPRRKPLKPVYLALYDHSDG